MSEERLMQIEEKLDGLQEGLNLALMHILQVEALVETDPEMKKEIDEAIVEMLMEFEGVEVLGDEVS